MRSAFVVGVLGTALSMTLATAQDGSSAASRKKRPSTAMDALFENGPERKDAMVEVRRQDAERRAKAEKAGAAEDKSDGKSNGDASASAQKAPAPVIPTVQAVPPGPPQKNLTGEEFRQLHVGSTAKDVLTVLGPPASRVVVPDDDGHLLETLQYWSKGAPLGTVRLDNGRVVQIETKAN